MSLLAFDLGGTKLTTALLTENGEVLYKNTILLQGRHGKEVAQLITESYTLVKQHTQLPEIKATGISVPGIYYAKTGCVWAPNIAGWSNYPLLNEVQKAMPLLPVTIDSDRACYILGEAWRGAAQGCTDAIFLAVGTGIGAGIMADGRVLRGSHDVAGAIGWMALQPPFINEYKSCGCFEFFASGDGIARTARLFIDETKDYKGELINILPNEITSHHVFDAFEKGDALAKSVLKTGIAFWGMAAANLISLFNPQKIIFGGGVFGPAIKLIPDIQKEAGKWSQPIAFTQVSFEPSALEAEAGVYGAAYLALQQMNAAKQQPYV